MKIELQHIQKRFGSTHANNDISLIFPAGSITGVLGENGAGKSTLMKILSGYQPPDSGQILIDDRVVQYSTPQGAIAAGIGMLQQDPLDVPAFTVLENFIYGQKDGVVMNRRSARKELTSLCDRLGFDIDPDMLISQLSMGQRQQLEIVRLLSLGVRTLILDEPTTGISAEQKTILFASLRQLAESGMSILLVSHKLEDVIILCDAVVVLRAGRVVGTASMPVSTSELVRLMFGQELATQERPMVEIKQPVVTLNDVTLSGKRVAVEHLNLNICSGEVIGLAGLDGSGQELILRAVAGLVKPNNGMIKLGEKVMTGKHYRDFMAQGVAFGAAGRLEEGLISGLSITEHIALVTEQRRLVRWKEAEQHAQNQIAHYNVRGRPSDKIERLSGGNQQRVLMALLPQQPLLMALEYPTRGLDVDSARWIWQQLLERRSSGTAILFTSPDLDELVAYSDRIFVLYAGRVFEIPDARKTTIEELGQLIGGNYTAQAVGE